MSFVNPAPAAPVTLDQVSSLFDSARQAWLDAGLSAEGATLLANIGEVYAVIDRDGVLGRMTRGVPAGRGVAARHALPALVAVAVTLAPET